MKKLNKKQSDAISTLVCDIDELSNKPRRLFSALRGVAEAFLDGKKQREHLNNVLDDIEEWEEDYYKPYYMSDLLRDVFNTCRKTRKELKSGNRIDMFFEPTKDYINGYVNGVDDSCTQMIKDITVLITEQS